MAKQLFECYITNRQQFVIRDLYWALFYLIYIYIYIYINDIQTCTNNFDIINNTDDTSLISTMNKLDNHSTGMNNNINNELTNIHNLVLA